MGNLSCSASPLAVSWSPTNRSPRPPSSRRLLFGTERHGLVRAAATMFPSRWSHRWWEGVASSSTSWRRPSTHRRRSATTHILSLPPATLSYSVIGVARRWRFRRRRDPVVARHRPAISSALFPLPRYCLNLRGVVQRSAGQLLVTPSIPDRSITEAKSLLAYLILLVIGKF